MLAVGSKALMNNTSGYFNTAIGSNTLKTVTVGSSNTALGAFADVNANGRVNATAIGYQATATADNQVRVGNTSVMVIGGAVPWTVISDGRFKKNIKENVPGLAFINLLKPITYTYDIHGLDKYIGAKEEEKRNGISPMEEAINKKEKIIYTGFVAQDVEKTAAKLNYDFSGVYKPQNNKDVYGLSYSDFVVPLIKAVQELSKQNDSLKQNNQVLNDKLNALSSKIDQIENAMSQCCSRFSSNLQPDVSSQSTSTFTQQSTMLSSASLGQNIPNPFNNTTTINYTLPQSRNGGTSAKIIITDKAGKVLKEINVSGSGKGSVKIDASTLAGGAYNYSLYVARKMIDTKQMMIAR
jgi:hypothetical protein